MARAVRLDVCCNNPDNGLFAHAAEAFQVTTLDGDEVEFESVRRAPRFAEVPGGIRMLRHVYLTSRQVEWYGNWCWNAYWLHPQILASLLYHAKRSGLFCCASAPCELYENWNGNAAFDRELWLARLIVPASKGEP